MENLSLVAQYDLRVFGARYLTKWHLREITLHANLLKLSSDGDRGLLVDTSFDVSDDIVAPLIAMKARPQSQF